MINRYKGNDRDRDRGNNMTNFKGGYNKICRVNNRGNKKLQKYRFFPMWR